MDRAALSGGERSIIFTEGPGDVGGSSDDRSTRRGLGNVASGRADIRDYGLPMRRAFGKLFWQGALFGLNRN